MLGLDKGGVCDGVALRLSEDNLFHELKLLWRREMVAAAYVPQWVDLLDKHGVRFGRGIAFTIDHRASSYADGLSHQATVERLATASGSIGSSADYLFRTRDGLRALGIADATLERLAADVESTQAGLR